MAVAGSLQYDTKLDTKGFDKGLNKLGGLAKTGAKVIGASFATVTTAVAGIVTASVKARGELEQQIGGVETLFKENADLVVKNAEQAYKTAGLSANKYMEMASSFSASLLQSTAGDTKKAAEVADMAMRDMSDNANKMGTDMSSIQNAYQGFAKQNYTMLDNLKLGYGGTKSEMERLLADAQKLTGVKYDISNLSDVYEAVHAIQNELGITGTTAKEATETLQGSISMLQASWENFLSGSGDLSTVVENVTIVVQNIIRIVSEAIPEIMDNLTKALPEFLKLGVDIIQKILTGIIENLPKLLEMGIQMITQLITGLVQQIPELVPVIIDAVTLIVETLIDNIDLLVDAGIELILALANGLIEALPRLIEKAPEIIQKLVEAFVRNFPKIVRAGGELLGKLIAGIVGSFWKLLEVAPQIISNIVNGLKQGWNEIKNIGKYLIQGLWNGISGMGNWIKDKIRSFAHNIISNMKNALGIHSPSRVMRDQVGQWIPKGIAVGIDANTDSALKSIDLMNDEIMDKMNKAVIQEKAVTNFGGMNGSVSEILSANSVIKVENYNTLELDGEKIYENQKTIDKNKNLQYGFGGAY